MRLGTTVVYNGVTIHRVLTNRFDQQAMYDSSNTDIIGSKFSIAVTGYVTLMPGAVLAAGGGTVGLSTDAAVSTAVNEQTARTKLMEARRPFLMTVEGVDLLNVVANAGNVNYPYGDIDNGPKPISLSINRICGENTMEVQFEIELMVLECESPHVGGDGVLNNRWALRENYGVDSMATRTINGQLRVVSGIIPNQHLMRSLILPPLADGFRRESFNVTRSRDGLTFDYEIVDQETYAAAPGKATFFEGTHSRATDNGATTIDDCRVTITAPKDVSKADMIAWAISVCAQKIGLFTKIDTGGPSARLTAAAVIDYLNEPKIDVRMSAQRFANAYRRALPMTLVNLPSDKLGLPIELDARQNGGEKYNRDINRIPANFGTSGFAAELVCFLQSPCDYVHGINDGVSLGAANTDKAERLPKPRTFDYKEGALPTDPTAALNYSSESLSGALYTHYEISSSYKTTSHTIQMPVALDMDAPGSANADTAYIVQIAPPTVTRFVSVVAQRVGDWPEMPSPESITFNGTPVVPVGEAVVTARAPRLNPDGQTYTFEVETHFRVALSRPIKASDILEIGSLPWDSSTLARNALPVTKFQQKGIA